jgi:hypothetical protein
VEGRLEDCDTVVLEHVKELVEGGRVSVGEMSIIMRWSARLTVVLPALSRPRKSSLACLFASPSWASMSQTIQQRIRQHHVSVCCPIPSGLDMRQPAV